jgi:large subunit ribosomal protein L2
MELIHVNPATPAQRHSIKLNSKHLKKAPLIKNKIKGLISQNGRNNSGRITVRHKGGGHKKSYREINYSRTDESTGIICSIEYDPNRNSNIASVYDFSKKSFYYMLAPKDSKMGDIVKSGSNTEPKLGYSLPLSKIPVGSFIHNIATKPAKPAQLSRSAGAFSSLKEKTLSQVVIRLSSGEQKTISSKCYATVGVVSNELVVFTKLGKAGQSRWLNKRPTVRGVAMNPVDHPHGGGEGKKSGKGKTPWGTQLRKKIRK